MPGRKPEHKRRSSNLRYKDIEITTRPAIDQPFNQDVAYYAEARHIFDANNVDQAREITFQADGYSEQEAIRQVKMQIEIPD